MKDLISGSVYLAPQRMDSTSGQMDESSSMASNSKADEPVMASEPISLAEAPSELAGASTPTVPDDDKGECVV